MSGAANLGRCAAIALALLAAGGAQAEIFSACSAKATRDGFVALRDRPSPAGGLLARMRPGEIVVVEVKNNHVVRSGDWLRVSHFPGEAMPNPGDPGFEKVKRGWAKDKLIDDCG
jgi:hypothetical protein